MIDLLLAILGGLILIMLFLLVQMFLSMRPSFVWGLFIPFFFLLLWIYVASHLSYLPIVGDLNDIGGALFLSIGNIGFFTTCFVLVYCRIGMVLWQQRKASAREARILAKQQRLAAEAAIRGEEGDYNPSISYGAYRFHKEDDERALTEDTIVITTDAISIDVDLTDEVDVDPAEESEVDLGDESGQNPQSSDEDTPASVDNEPPFIARLHTDVAAASALAGKKIGELTKNFFHDLDSASRRLFCLINGKSHKLIHQITVISKIVWTGGMIKLKTIKASITAGVNKSLDEPAEPAEISGNLPTEEKADEESKQE